MLTNSYIKKTTVKHRKNNIFYISYIRVYFISYFPFILLSIIDFFKFSMKYTTLSIASIFHGISFSSYTPTLYTTLLTYFNAYSWDNNYAIPLSKLIEGIHVE